MAYQYKMDDLPCGLCADILDDGCPHSLCPYIMENLGDLRKDPKFVEAIADAESCDTYHRPTLLLLKWLSGYIDEQESAPPAPVPSGCRKEAGHRPECEGCPFPATGFVCDNGADGSCMKTDFDAMMRKKDMGATPSHGTDYCPVN